VPLTLSGQVFNTRGDILPDAIIEIWQANHQGYYDLDGYRYRGKLQTDNSGAYGFESVIPGHYPDKSRICQSSTELSMQRRRCTRGWRSRRSIIPARLT
jgi:protocatechuate 3,4-dioxygenase beta subunit